MKDVLSRLSWPQVVGLAIVVAGVVALVALVPEEYRGEALVAALPVLLGAEGLRRARRRLLEPRDSVLPTSISSSVRAPGEGSADTTRRVR